MRRSSTLVVRVVLLFAIPDCEHSMLYPGEADYIEIMLEGRVGATVGFTRQLLFKLFVRGSSKLRASTEDLFQGSKLLEEVELIQFVESITGECSYGTMFER